MDANVLRTNTTLRFQYMEKEHN